MRYIKLSILAYIVLYNVSIIEAKKVGVNKVCKNKSQYKSGNCNGSICQPARKEGANCIKESDCQEGYYYSKPKDSTALGICKNKE